jgi:cation transport protein ChaC
VSRHPILHREAILSGEVERMIREARGDIAKDILPDAERRRILAALLADMPAGRYAWLFAYGSLMWNPAFHFDVERRALVRGWHRRFCYWTTLGRGTREQPGLMLALEPGGACGGLVYGVERARAADELYIVFRRELLTGTYRARLVRAETAEGPVRAITFVANPTHPTYAGRLSWSESGRHIARACGHLGTCREYLHNTAGRLADLGIRDRTVETLLRYVDAADAEPG